MTRVLVTGGSGFIGSHCILGLLAAGHRVRTTVRNLQREPEVRAMLEHRGDDPDLTFHAATLERDDGWREAVDGVEYVLHVASPFPPRSPRLEEELVVPAREGTLRVLRAARAAHVKRVVITSSFAAIGYGHRPQQAPFDETYWSNVDEPVAAYVKSKTLAERAAWQFIAEEGEGLELVAVNPVAVLGPVLGRDYSTSIEIVERMLSGGMPAAPRLMFGVVDVRDVAALHLKAMSEPAAKGERFLAAAGDFMWLLDIARVLRARLGIDARRVPTRTLPDWVLRLTAMVSPTVRELLPELGKTKNASHDRAVRLLGWAPRSNEDAIVATAESLLRLGRR
jgi:nucleoside-diphosphate-sugar epimerase